MDGTETGSILIRLVDGTRRPLADTVKWSAVVHDGRSPDEWRQIDVEGNGSAELIKGLTYFNNLFDNYTVIVRSDGYDDAAWMPVHVSPSHATEVNLMLIQKGAHLNFSGASWKALLDVRPRFAEIFSAGVDDAPKRYADLAEEHEGLILGCLLNLLTAMSEMTLPSRRSPLDYYWQPIWDSSQFPMAQDRFFAYVDKAFVEDVIAAGKVGSFAEEKDPDFFHPGATLSYKQTQFNVTNVQLTFHEHNEKTIQTPGGPVQCVVVEPDIDYYKDLLAHSLAEVLPNKLTGGLTDPRVVYQLRWMAGKESGSEFDPLYTLTA